MSHEFSIVRSRQQDPKKITRAANLLREWLLRENPQSRGIEIALQKLSDDVLVQRSRQSPRAQQVLAHAGLLLLLILCPFLTNCGGGNSVASNPPPPNDPPPILAPLVTQTVQVETTANFAVTITSGTPPFNYVWTVNGSDQNDDSASLSYTPSIAGADTISVTVSNAVGQASENTTLTVQNSPTATASGFVQAAMCGYETADKTCSNTFLNVAPQDFLAWAFFSAPNEANAIAVPPTETCLLVQLYTFCFSVTDTQQDQFIALAGSNSGAIGYVMAFDNHATGGNTALELPSGLNPSTGTLLLVEYASGTIFDMAGPCLDDVNGEPPGQTPSTAVSFLNATCVFNNFFVNTPTQQGTQTAFQYKLPNACGGSNSSFGVALTFAVEDGSTQLLVGSGSSQRLNVSGTSENILVQDTYAPSPSLTITWNSAASLSGDTVMVLNLGLLGPTDGCS